MNSITKLTTLTLIGALAVTGAHAGMIAEDPAASAATIVKQTQRRAEKAAIKAAYDEYREGLRLEDLSDFTSYMNDKGARPIDVVRATKSNCERQYASLQSEALSAARKAVNAAFHEGLQTARKVAKAEAAREVGRFDPAVFRARRAAFTQAIREGLCKAKAKQIADKAMAVARDKRIEELVAEKMKIQQSLVHSRALEAGFQHYAKAEVSAYQQGKWYLNQEFPKSAPKSRVETESAPATPEETAPVADEGIHGEFTLFTPAIGHNGAEAAVLGTTYADTIDAGRDLGSDTYEAAAATGRALWSGVNFAGHLLGLGTRMGVEISKPVASEIVEIRTDVEKQGGYLNWIEGGLFGTSVPATE